MAEDLDMLDEAPSESVEVQSIPDAVMTPAEQAAKTEQEILELNNRLQTENLDEFTKQSIVMRLEELTGQELSKSPNSVADVPYTSEQKEQVTDLATRMKALGVEVLGDKLTDL